MTAAESYSFADLKLAETLEVDADPLRCVVGADLPKTTVLEAAERVAARQGIGSGWLNDAVKGFMHGDDPSVA